MINYIKNKEFLDLKDKIFDIDFLNSKSPKDHEWSMDYKEGTILYNIVMNLNPQVIIETGTFHGFSASYMLQALEDLDYGIIFTIELDKKRCNIAEKRLCKVGKRYSIIHSNSRMVAWSQPIDMLFIDGEHGRVKEDLDKYEPFVNKGGLVLCHDYHGIHCKNGINEFFSARKNQFDTIILTPDEFKNDLYIAIKI